MMQGNGKETGGIRHKLGSLFSPRGPPQASRGREEVEHGTFITADVLRELEGVPTQRRVRAMRELCDIVATKQLEEHAVQAIWKAVQDLLQPRHTADVRHAVLRFTQALVAGQYSELGMMRAHFFKVIQSHRLEEDAQQRLDLLVALTQGGRDIQYFEEAIGSFLVEWMPEATSQASVEDFLGLLVKIVHYNSAYLGEDVLSLLVSLTCSLANQATTPSVTELCLSFLDAVMCYSSFPTSTIHACVVTLCHTLNIERFIQRSLEVMQRLLGTHLGPTVVYAMCGVLQDKAHADDILLLRGAVFYISMSLWGVKRVETLAMPFTAVLPAIHQVAQSGHTIVVYEVALSVLRLVRHYAPHLETREWEAVHRILRATHHHLTEAQQALRDSAPAAQLQATLQDTYSCIEQYWEGGVHSIGPAHLFFQLLDDIRESLPVHSVLSLIQYRSQVIDSADVDWLQQITDFMHKFYQCEGQTVVRKEALAYLARVMEDHWLTQEESLLQHILLPFLKPLPQDVDPDLRCQAVQLLVHFLPSSSASHALLMLDLLSQVLKKGLQDAEQGGDACLPDCKAAVFGLTQLLRESVHRPGPLAGQVFSVLVQFLRQVYSGQPFTATSCDLRINIFDCLLSMRADKNGQVGFYDNDLSELKYSPFHVCNPDGGQRSMPFARTIFHFGGVFEAATACLNKDVEWEAVFQLLRLLREALQCRTLTLSAMPDLSPFLPPLCSLAEGHSSRLELFNHKPDTTEVASSLYPLLATLATYPGHLDRRAQHDLVCCLEAGLVGKEAGTCTAALTVCSLELQATMTRFLPRVLYRLSQVTATPSMAMSVLEFLAGLIPIPALVSGFVEEEYLSVFGIALPYTNPHRYSPYVVAMAHRVISMWFLRCHLRYRPKAARFISKGLSVHVEMVGGGRGEEGGQLCQDLTEATLDMLARYSYSSLSCLPTRSSGADFLLSGGPSKTWALGNYLITVTTTGEAGGKPGRCAQCVSELAREWSRGVATATEDSSLHDEGLCSCWGWGWAEVKVRRPSGNTAWMLRLQNRLQREGGRRGRELSAVVAAAAYNYPFEEEEETREAGGGMVGRPGGQLGGQKEGEGEMEQMSGGDQTLFPWFTDEDGVQEMKRSMQPPPASSAVPEGPMAAGPITVGHVTTGSTTSPCAIERMPPLLSYEEAGPGGRSPSLHSSPFLTEQEQLSLVARAYLSSECESHEQSSEDEQTDAQLPTTVPCGAHEERGGKGGREEARPSKQAREGEGAGRGETPLLLPPAESPALHGDSHARPPALHGDSHPRPPAPHGDSHPRPPVPHGDTQPQLSVLPDSGPSPAVSPSMACHRITFQPHPSSGGRVAEETELSNNPSFVFLQLFHSAALSLPPAPGHTPLLLSADEAMVRAVKLLDHIPPYNTHKIGVVYVSEGQTSEAEILANTSGSSQFQEFLSGLGQLLRLADCPPDQVYLGGLDRGGSDGEYAYFYEDDTTQVVFHVATLMPTLPSDPQCSNKKLHIGNDFVTLVYNETGRPYQFGTIKGQFCYAEVVVEPLPAAVNRVCVAVRMGMEGMLSVEPQLCSSLQLPILARTKALHANFASLVHVSESPSFADHHPSNWLCRLRQIRRIRERCMSDYTSLPSTTFPDFTIYS